MSSVIDLRAYVNPSVVQTLVLVDLQQEYTASPRVLALENTKGELAAAPIRIPLQWPKDRQPPKLLRLGTDWAQLTEPNFVTEKIKAENGEPEDENSI